MSKKYNIKWTEDDSKELARTVKNFNAKISRLEKKNPAIKNTLPEKVSVKEMKELIDTRQDLKRELNSLKRFTQRGSEQLVTVPDNDYNLQITKWQKNEMTRRAGVINRKRKVRLQEISDIEMTSRGEKLGYTRGQLGMGKADEVALSPINAFTPKMTRTSLRKKFEVLKKESQSTYWRKRELQLMENYKNSLLRNFKASDVEEIINVINDMDFKEFYKIYQGEGGNFENVYHLGEEEKFLTALKATWLPNKKGA